MATRVDIDITGLESFIDRLNRAAKGEFREELETYLEAIGTEFLRVLQDEIMRRQVIDTRQLLNSFTKGTGGNIWQLNEGGLTLEVGTSVKYAGYVNDGHWTNPKGKATRWVPGSWEGDRFTYSPGAKTGMLLKQHWVEGKHYWESGLRIIEQMFPELLDKKLQEWMNRYFGG